MARLTPHNPKSNDFMTRTKPTLPLISSVEALPTFQPGAKDAWWRWGSIFCFFALYLCNCGSFGLWDPWEVHYGEVTRNMIESYDWVNPWWGYKIQIGSEPKGGNWFYSKPVWIFWAEAVFVKLIGLSDWAFRIPIALIGASAVSMTLWAAERIVGLRRALMIAWVMGLSPFIYMVSRQAQTDMPFVATMTIALCFAALAMFSRREMLSDRGFAGRLGLFTLFSLVNLVPQWSIIATDLTDAGAGGSLQGLPRALAQLRYNGVYHLLFYVPVGVAVLASVLWPCFRARRQWDEAFKDRTLRRIYWLCFYMMAAQATYAKGLLGFMLPGAVLFAWFVVTGQWRAIGRVELLRGLPLFLVTVLPWYVAMFCRHGMAYYNRFFVHDHFNRMGSGVHQIDHGTFEHFIKWLGFGLFPWTVFVPMALVAWVRLRPARLDGREADGATLYRVFLLCWFWVAFALFTASSTKFHHYILPTVPALTALVGLYLFDLKAHAPSQRRFHLLLSLGFGAALLVNLLDDPQHLRNLFTYKYDRPMPTNLPLDWDAPLRWSSDAQPLLTWSQTEFARHLGGFSATLLSLSWLRYDGFILAVGALAGLGLLIMLWRRVHHVGVGMITVSALLLAIWSLNYYMPMLSPSWSQRYLFESYYRDCTLHPNPAPVEEAYTPWIEKAGMVGLMEFFGSTHKRVCEEDIISWLITWRGETFYSNNEIRPINKEAAQFEPYLRDFNKGQPFYVLMERGRTSGFRSTLNRVSRKLKGQQVAGFKNIEKWQVELVNNESAYFVVARCRPDLTAKATSAEGHSHGPPAHLARRERGR